jgi:thiamine-phosphate pyrophosphorylase
VAALARGGARVLQLRAKRLSDRDLLEAVRGAVDAARREGGLLIVNDRPDVALVAGADGVHLGQDDLAPRDARRLLGPGTLLGLSTHTLEQVAVAASEPVDYVAFGPVFPTTTKDAVEPAVGTEGLRRARALTRLPLVAIGGITEANVSEVVEAGADGVAVISALLRAADLSAAARGFQAALGRTA